MTQQAGQVLADVVPAAELLVSQCPTLCDPMNGSPPGSSVHGILQARILEWLPFPPPGNRTRVSRIAGRFFTI